MLPYGLILLVASVALTIRYVAIADASRWSKLAVAIVVVVSLVMWWNLYQWQWRVLVIVLQLAVSVYALLYFKAHSNEP